MSSFDQLLVDLQRQKNGFDIIYDALLKIVMKQSNHYSLYNKLEPFLQHVNDGGSLNALCSQLQNSANNNNKLFNKSLVYNVVNSSKTNEKLEKLLKTILGIVD